MAALLSQPPACMAAPSSYTAASGRSCHPAKGVHVAEPSRLVQSVRAQYANASNLDARIRVHAAYSTNPQGWPRWLFAATRCR